MHGETLGKKKRVSSFLHVNAPGMKRKINEKKKHKKHENIRMEKIKWNEGDIA